MVYYGRTANEHVDLHLSVVVEGIPFVFVERSLLTAPASYGGRTPIVCLARVEEGESTLSYEDRREMAATLDLEMLDEGGVLADLFATASRSVTWASATATASATTLTLASTAPLVGGQHIYVGAETITVGTVASGTSLTGCTRGAFGSTASALYGTSSDGDSVYSVPPFWRGRRVSLYGHAPDAAGLYTSTLLGTYLIDEAPMQVGELRWTLRCAGIVQEYWERSVGLGVRDASIQNLLNASPFLPAYDTAGGIVRGKFRSEDKTAFRTSSAGFPAYVMLTQNIENEPISIHEIVSHDSLTGDVIFKLESEFSTPTLASVGDIAGGRARQIAVIQAPGASSILIALMSTDGQGLSLSGNQLPGRDPTNTYDAGWRFGAGFTSSEIDTAAFREISAIPPMTLIIDGERKVTDLLLEWCLLTGTAIVSTVDGKIKPITMAAPRLVNTTTIGADDVIPDGEVSVTHDESSVFPLVKVTAGYSPITGEFHDEINLIDVELAKKYQRSPQRTEIEIRSVDVWEPHLGRGGAGWRHPTRQRTAAMASMIFDVMRGSALGRRFISLSLSHEHLGLRIGDVITFGSDLPDAYDLPDFRGGSILGLSARVVARRPRYDQARVDVRLEMMDRLLHVCPAARITTHSSGLVTLATSGAEVAESGFPTNGFWVGANVLVFDRSSLATGSPVVDAFQISSIPSTTQMQLSGSLSFALQSGVDYVVLDPENSANGTGADGYSLVEMAKLADDDGNAGSNVNTTNEPRWR